MTKQFQERFRAEPGGQGAFREYMRDAGEFSMEGGSGGAQWKSRKIPSQETYNSTLGARQSLWVTHSMVTEDDRGKSG